MDWQTEALLVLCSNCEEADSENPQLWFNVANQCRSLPERLQHDVWPFGSTQGSGSIITPVQMVVVRHILDQAAGRIDGEGDPFGLTTDLPPFAEVAPLLHRSVIPCGDKARSVLADLVLHYEFARQEVGCPSEPLWHLLSLLGMHAAGPFLARYSASPDHAFGTMRWAMAQQLLSFALSIDRVRARFNVRFQSPELASVLCWIREVHGRSSVARSLLQDLDADLVLPLLNREDLSGSDWSQLGVLLASLTILHEEDVVQFVRSGERGVMIAAAGLNHAFGIVKEEICGDWRPPSQVGLKSISSVLRRELHRQLTSLPHLNPNDLALVQRMVHVVDDKRE